MDIVNLRRMALMSANSGKKHVDSDGKILDSWDEIIASIDANKYSKLYKVGDYKALDLGSEGIIDMQIVAMDADELTDGNGNAPLTFLSSYVLNNERQMHTANNSSIYSATSLNKWLNSTVLSLIPNNVKSIIVSVNKTFKTGTGTAIATDSFKIWIPSARELKETDTSLKESSGVEYDIFSTKWRRKKTHPDPTAYNVPSWWCYWTRTHSKSSSYQYRRCAGTDGAYRFNNNMTEYNYVCIGFCLG